MNIRKTTILLLLPALCAFIFSCTSAPVHSTPPSSNGSGTNDPTVIKVEPVKEYSDEKKGVYVHTLPNGMRVVVIENHSAPVVTVQVTVHTGSMDEGECLGCGLSHLVEHVIMNGTTIHHTGDEGKKLEKIIGAGGNAYTNNYCTAYFLNAPSCNFEQALDILADRITYCTFDPKEVDRELGVISQEISMGEEDPGRRINYLFNDTAYDASYFRIPIIGYREEFLRLSREDAVKYYRARYVPGNMVLAIAGDVPAKDAMEQAAKVFEKFRNRPLAEVKYPEEPTKTGRRYVEREANIQMAMLRMGFRTMNMFSPDAVKTDMLAAVMGTGKNSRLYKRLVEEKRLVQDIYAFNFTPDFVHGHLMIGADMEPANIEAVQTEIMSIAQDLKTNLVSKEDLDRARSIMRADLLLGRQTASDQLGPLVDSILLTGDPLYEDKYFAAMDAVTPEDVREMANKYLNEDNVTVVVFKPFSKTPATEALPPLEIKEQESGIEKITLKNGLTVLLKRNPELPLVSIQTYAHGGILYEGDEHGICNFMVEMLRRGTTSKTASDIDTIIETMGMRMETVSGANTFGITMTVLKENEQTGIDLVADVLLRPRFADEEVERVRKQVLFQIQNINNDFGREVGALFRKVRFGDHPYANMTVGDAESVSKITAADLRTFHDRLCVGDNTVLAVGGDIDIEKTRKMIESAFGEMPQGEKQPNHVPPPPTIGKDSKGVAAPVAVNVPRQQVNVILATNGIAIGDADDAAMNILTNMFSGNLYQALRGRNNYVYIISVFHAPGVDAGTLEIFAQTTPDKYDVMMKEIRVEIDKMKNGKFTDEEFEAAKRQAVYYAQMDLQTNAEQADAAALNELYGLGYDYAAKNALRLSKVTRQDLTKLIERCFGEWMVVETRPAPPDKPAPVPDPADEE